jgi:signal recognition particle subunit SRP54
MFESLSDKLQDTLKRLRGEAKLTESNIGDAMQDIRMALLDADVNLNVATDFVDSVRKECIGVDVLRTVTPGQQVIKIVNDKLVELMGDSEVPLKLDSKPSVIMMVGLHGSGKTTTAAKLALHLKKNKKKVLLAAGDIYRPAAIDQLEVLGNEIDVPVYLERDNSDVAAIARNAVNHAITEHLDVVIIDTAGRLQIDLAMVQELVKVSQASRADEILLVADAALGQEAVSVAEHFHEALTLTGLILTKLDGDARGGAALSIRKVTGCPVKFVGSGERLENLEIFYPERMASRILGMGDVVSLVEKAAEEIDEKEAKRLHEKLKKNQFDFNDFLGQLRQMSKLGGAESILKMLPGGRDMAKAIGDVDPKHFSHMEAIICSMTSAEREDPDLISFPRRKRIAKGSGTSLEEVARLVKQFSVMRKMMKKTGLLRQLIGGGMSGMGGMSSIPESGMESLGLGVGPSRKDIDRKRKLEKLKKKQKQKQRKKNR